MLQLVMPKRTTKFAEVSIRPTLLIQKCILRFKASAGIPIAAARFLAVQLKKKIQYNITTQPKQQTKGMQRLLRLPWLILKFHNDRCMNRGYCELHFPILKLQLQLNSRKW